jgi:hypothetical protein
VLATVCLPAVREGEWRLLDCMPAWEGNWTWDDYIAFSWKGRDGAFLLVVVNYAPNQGQCYIQLPFDFLQGKNIQLRDRFGPDIYDRDGDKLISQGMYFDEPAWSFHIFEITVNEREDE